MPKVQKQDEVPGQGNLYFRQEEKVRLLRAQLQHKQQHHQEDITYFPY